MLVFTNDVKQLIDKAISKFEENSKTSFGEPSMQEFFKSLIQRINSEQRVKLNNDTFYKQYYIKIKSHNSSEIGYSVTYLNAISQYAYSMDYLDKFPRVIEDENEIPEFPSHHPCFPATPAIKIPVSYKSSKGVKIEFTDLWIKDEYHNPTGTHKDRKAHELYLHYNKILKEQLENSERVQLQRLSLISSGYAALALQYRLYKSGLPNLKVLIDKKTPDHIKEMLYKSKAEVFEEDLSVRLNSEQIKKITENEDGKDITNSDEISDASYVFYDWLSYECLNLNPNWLFMPYGSGELYKNILEVHAKELKSKNNSKRYFGNKAILKDCNFVGVRPKENSFESAFYCLTAPHDMHEEKEVEHIYKYGGQYTGIARVNENTALIKQAIKICKKNNIKTEASGIAGLVYLFQMIEEGKMINPNAKIVIINTGTIKSDLF